MRSIVFILIFLLILNPAIYAKDLYCGNETCYQVLNTTSTATTDEIRRAFRKIASIYHPDVNKDPNALEVYKKLTNAYEILKNKKDRKAYDDYLSDPDNLMSIYGYYKRAAYNKIDARIVVVVSLIILSLLQYFLRSQNYDAALKEAMKKPKYQNLALKEMNNKNPRIIKRRDLDDDELEDYEVVLAQIVKESPEFFNTHFPPSWRLTVLGYLILIVPKCFIYLMRKSVWFYKYTLLRREYDEEAKIELTCKALDLSIAKFRSFHVSERDYYIDLKLWEKDNLKAFKKEMDIQNRKMIAESGKAKAFKRFMRNGGFGRMTFED